MLNKFIRGSPFQRHEKFDILTPLTPIAEHFIIKASVLSSNNTFIPLWRHIWTTPKIKTIARQLKMQEWTLNSEIVSLE